MALHKDIELFPTQPSGGWSLTLPPKGAADFTVAFKPLKVNGITYVYKDKSATIKITGDNKDVMWTMSSNTAAALLNPNSIAATTTAVVTGIWVPEGARGREADQGQAASRVQPPSSVSHLTPKSVLLGKSIPTCKKRTAVAPSRTSPRSTKPMEP